MTFRERLVELRQKAGLSQSELAEKAGLSLPGLRHYEHGLRTPTWVAVVKIARALGVPTGDFDDCAEATEEEVEKKKHKKPKAAAKRK